MPPTVLQRFDELEVKAGKAGKVHFVAQPGSQISQDMTLAEIQ